MAAGEHMATKSPAELFEGEITLERQHIRAFGEEGLRELGEPLGLVGLEGELREKAVEHFARDDASLLHVMTALEFGVVETERRKPHMAMWLSGVMFTVGSLPPVLPFAFSVNPRTALMLAAACTIVGVLAVGEVKTWATPGKPGRSAIENLLVATLGGGFAYGVGTLFDRFVGGA
jgi:VIT1/CCC1 family predicted Fe2+/Mn2+ transporter